MTFTCVLFCFLLKILIISLGDLIQLMLMFCPVANRLELAFLFYIVFCESLFIHDLCIWQILAELNIC